MKKATGLATDILCKKLWSQAIDILIFNQNTFSFLWNRLIVFDFGEHNSGKVNYFC